MDNTTISQQVNLHRHQVRHWRNRWQESIERLKCLEQEGGSDAAMMQLITTVLSDEARLGGPAKFGVEQIVKMIAVACVFCLPVVVVRFPIGLQPRHANEVVQRGIVESISHRSVGRFLKASNLTTPRESPDKYGQPL